MDSMGQVPPRRAARRRTAGFRRSRWTSVLSTVLATVLAAAAAIALDTSAASAATVDTNAWYVLVNRNSGKAIDVAGASTADDWGLFRFLNSQVATLLARPLTSISDPMSGFFALPRSVFERAREPSPLGYKIGLELLVRCEARNVREIPIHFANRTRGESKLTAKQQLLYLQHLARLYRFKLGI